jgi:hypothetical protein
MSNKSIAVLNIEDENEYLKWCKSLKVDSKVDNYIQLIIDHSKEIEKRKSREKEKYKEYLPFEIQYRLKYERYTEKRAVLNIDVSNKQSNRAYKFMNCFIEAVQAIGGNVSVDFRNSDNTVIRFPYCTFECSLVEKRGKYRDVKPKEIKSMRPSYDIVETGKLIFNIFVVDKNGKPYNEFIYDEEKVPLNEQIANVFINLRPIYINVTNSNIEIERKKEKEAEDRNRQWELEWEEEKVEKERKKQHEIREKQQSIIVNHMDKFYQIIKVEKYVGDLLDFAEQQPESILVPIKQYCEYAKGLFDEKDLLLNIIEFIQKEEIKNEH